MTGRSDASDTALRIADRLRAKRSNPFDLFAERLRHYEIHLNGTSIEMRRGPILLEGYGYRELVPSEGAMRVGFAASSDLTPAGIDRTVRAAELAGSSSSFPARSVELPGASGTLPSVESVDRILWAKPEETIESFAQALLAPFDGRPDPRPSFGSIRATLSEVSLANSAGLEARFDRTLVSLEMAVTSRAGAEGPAPGEYWVTQDAARIDLASAANAVDGWCRKAGDARRARRPDSGTARAALPPEVLSQILPEILAVRFGGLGELRGMMPPLGSVVASDSLDIVDDPFRPNALSTAPVDDEGHPSVRRPIVERGRLVGPVYDLLYASALGRAPTASARRELGRLAPWFRFASPPLPGLSTLCVRAGSAGSDAEIAEAIGEGIWIDQLGYAFPDASSSAYGGEIRLGYRIEGGKLTEPLRGGTAGGVVLAAPGEPSLLRSAAWVGRDPRLVGRLDSPTIAVEGLAISGG